MEVAVLAGATMTMCLSFFSSPEPKAQVTLSDHNLFVFRRRRCHKLFNFNQSWYKPFLGEVDSSSIEGPRPF